MWIEALARRLGAAVLAGPLLCAAAPARAQEDFAACLSTLRRTAAEAGVGDTFESLSASLQPNDVLHFQGEQPEFRTAVWDYLAGLVDDERIADGRAKLAQWSGALRRIQSRFGVDPAIVVAVWGVESDYGKQIGARPILQSLATLGCYGDRPGYFRSEFVAALKIVAAGDVSPDRFTGSWAGAFGHTQFMPSTFLRNAIDMEGNGHPNIVDSVPDALATTANYLRKSGWASGVPWGYEVKLPPGYAGPAGRRNRKAAAAWAKLGVTRVDGGAPSGAPAGLLLPAGRGGPAFLVTRNFDAVRTYNAADVYALAVGLLADRIRGGGPLATPWPTDDPPLSRAERKEMQALLLAKGYPVEKTDGVIGVKTLQAIADYQSRTGLAGTARASESVLKALREGR